MAPDSTGQQLGLGAPSGSLVCLLHPWSAAGQQRALQAHWPVSPLQVLGWAPGDLFSSRPAWAYAHRQRSQRENGSVQSLLNPRLGIGASHPIGQSSSGGSPESGAEIDSASCWEEPGSGQVRGVDAERRILAATFAEVLPPKPPSINSSGVSDLVPGPA